MSKNGIRGRPFVKGQSGNPGGRRRGSFGAKKREALAIAAGDDPIYNGRKPRDILRSRMNALWEEGSEEAKDKACQIAGVLMPYEHARLQAVDVSATMTKRSVREMSDEELLAIIQAGEPDEQEEAPTNGGTH